MVRTRDTASVKVAGAKAPRKEAPSYANKSSGDDASGKNKYSGGNSYCPRETPAWQKNITCFFGSTSTSSNTNESSSNSVTEGSPTKTSTDVSQSSDSTSPANSEDSSNKENVAGSSSS